MKNTHLLLCTLCTAALIGLTGCMTGNDAVPSTTIEWSPATGQAKIKAPKNSELEGFEITRTGTNFSLKLTKGKFDNDPNVVGAAYAGQAAMLKETMALAEKMLELGIQVGTGKALAPAPNK